MPDEYQCLTIHEEVQDVEKAEQRRAKLGRLTGSIPVVQGWTSLAVILLFFSGVQLITIGALGEYIGRIYAEVRARPLYLVSEQIGRPVEARGNGTPRA